MESSRLRKEDEFCVERLLEEIEPLSEAFYLTGSSVTDRGYEDVDVVVETDSFCAAVDELENYVALEVERSFGQLQSRRTDKWLIQGYIQDTEFDITIHRPPYNPDFYSSEHIKLM